MSLNKKLFSGASTSQTINARDYFETVTYTGTGATQKITGYIKKGAGFDGNSSFIDTGITNHTLAWGYAAWVNTSNSSSSNCVLATLNGSGSSSGVDIVVQNDGKLRALFHNSGSNMGSTYEFGSGLNDGNWHFVAYTWDGINGNTATVRIDGTKYTQSTSIAGTTTHDASLKIGRFGASGGGTFFNGVIDQVRIFNKKLSDSELDTLYAEKTSDPSTVSTTDIFSDGSGVQLYELNENSYSSNFLQGAVFNGTQTSSGSKIEIPQSIFNNGALNTFTVSAWFKSSITSQSQVILSTQPASSNTGFSIFLGNSTGYLRAQFSAATGSGAPIMEHQVNMADGNWHNVILAYNDTGGTNNASSFMYVDGVDVTSSVTDVNGWSQGSVPTWSSFTTNRVNLGMYFDGTNYIDTLNGGIDQVRIYSSVLTGTDITKLFNESSQITTSNLVAHYKLDGNADDSAGSNNGTESNITYAGGVYSGTDTDVSFLGLDFQPDFVWIKKRSSSTSSDHSIQDSVRGFSGGGAKILYPNLDLTETTNADSNYFRSFDSNGFTLGGNTYYNGSNETYVAWCFNAPTTETNTDGNVQTNVKKNINAGFSIVEFANNNSTSNTFGHGLGGQPELVLIKGKNVANDWFVYVDALGKDKRLKLNKEDAQSSWSSNDGTNTSTGINSTVLTFAYSSSSYNFIAYCFRSISKIQKVGTYLGNGTSKDVYTTDDSSQSGTNGFEPSFLLIKKATGTPTAGWHISDSVRNKTNPRSARLTANSSGAESDNSTAFKINYNSDGFTVATTDVDFNDNNETYIYLAIA